MVHHGAALRSAGGAGALEAALRNDWRSAPVDDRLRALLTYAVKLTREPQSVERKDIEPLRDAGLSDREILDLVEITAYFNFVNRISDGLGVELE